MTRSRRFFASSPWIATGTPDYVNLGYTSRGLAKQALMRLSRKSLAIFRKLGLDHRIGSRFFPDDSPPEVILGHGESGKLGQGFKHTNFQKREIAFVLLMIWWAVQDSNLRPPACKSVVHFTQNLPERP
jgi:hypothetical protein